MAKAKSFKKGKKNQKYNPVLSIGALVLGVLIIAVAGILVMRYSQAGTKPNFSAATYGCGNPFGTTLRPGDTGPCVSYMEALIAKKYKLNSNAKRRASSQQGVVVGDNKYDNTTAYYVKRFQKENGLQQDGIVGIKTWGALYRACYVSLWC